MQIVEQMNAGATLPTTGAAGALRKVERLLGSLVGIAAAALVVAEIVVLFAGVSSRYLFQKPIIWTDELAGILFLWLAMLGAVLAFQRAEHMRMTAVIGMLKPQARAFLDVLAIAAPLAFLVLVLHPAYEFAADEIAVTTPALDISNVWRASALPIGLGLMTLFAVLRLASIGDWKLTGSAVALIVARWRRALSAEPGLDPARQHQPSHLLRRTGGGDGVRGSADRVCVWPGDFRFHHSDDVNAGDGRGWREWTKA